LADLLVDEEQVPVEFVEISLLRQTLEDAMDSQLSPHERDVLRLRLGLDDGRVRTVREITDLSGGMLSQAGKFLAVLGMHNFANIAFPNFYHIAFPDYYHIYYRCSCSRIQSLQKIAIPIFVASLWAFRFL